MLAALPSAVVLAEPVIDDASLRHIGLENYWSASLPLPQHDALRSAYLVDDALYAISEGGIVYALRADVGLIRWAEKLVEREYAVFRPTHLLAENARGPVVIATAGPLFIFDRYSGESLGRFKLPFPAGGGAAGIDDRLFMGGMDGRMHALLWDQAHGGRLLQRWEALTGGSVTATPVLFHGDRLLFVAARKGVVVACAAENREQHWAFSAEDGIMAEPAVDDQAAYVASLDRSLYKIDLRTGEVHWRLRFMGPLRESPVLGGATVYQYCAGQGLSAIDTASGEEHWRRPTGRAFAAATPEQAVVFTAERTLEVVDHDTGTVIAATWAGDTSEVVANVRDESVYVFSRDGRVQCVRPAGTGYLRAPLVQAARRRLTEPPPAEAAAPAPRDQEAAARDAAEDDPLRSPRDRKP